MAQIDTSAGPGPMAGGIPARADWRRDVAIGAAGFAVEAVLFGVLYSFGVVLEPIRDDLGASTSVIALMPAISAFLLFFAGPLTGWLADRFGTHRTVAGGGVCLAAGLWLATVAPSTWLVVTAYGILGGLAASLAYVPVIALVAALPSRRAPALVGLVVAGVGVGTAIAAPVMERAVEAEGWRTVYRAYGVLALVVMSGASLVFARHRPAVTGRQSILAALRPHVGNRDFQRLYLGLLLVCPSIYLGLIFLPKYLTDRALSTGQAALAASVLAICSAGGRVVLSALGARVATSTLFRASIGLLAVSLAVWLVAGTSYPLLLVYAAATGTGYGGTIGLAPSVTAERYGRAGLGAIIGGLYTSLGVGALATGPAAGAVIDRWGYRPAIIAIGLMAAVATVILPSAPPRAAGA